MFVWGNDWSGQLGDGGAGSAIPFLLTGVSNVTAIAGGGQSSMISTADGSLYVWGNSGSGQQSVPYLVNLYANYSSDGSGLPDWWEILHFGHLGVDPTADPDGDGWSNLQEYQNGTDPSHFDTPPTPSGLVVTQAFNQANITLTWNAASPTPVNYAILRQDFNPDTLNYVSQQIGEVAGSVTFFVDDGSIGGGNANSVYEIEAIYSGGSSPLSAQTYVNSTAPASLNDNLPLAAQLVRNSTGRWQLMFSSIPASVQTIRLFWYSDDVNYTSQDIATNGVVNGSYQIPDADVVNYLGNTLYVEGFGTSVQPGQVFYVGVLSADAPYFVDGRRDMKQNLSFLIRGASLNQPYGGHSRSLYQFTQTTTNFEEFSFLHHDWQVPYPTPIGPFLVLDNLWPFEANYSLANYIVDVNRSNSYNGPAGNTNFNFQPNFATNMPAPPVLTHADPYWILQWGFYSDGYNPSDPNNNTTDWGVTLSQTNRVAHLQSGISSLFGLPYQTGCMIEQSWINGATGYPILPPSYEPLGLGDTITALLAPTNGYMFVYYASWCPPPTLNLVNYYFAPLINPNADPLFLPADFDPYGGNVVQPFPSPVMDGFAVTNQTPAVIFGAVGQPMILGSWAKYSVQGSNPTKYAYLGQYFTTNAFKVDTNGNLAANTTGVISPYGEFFPTEPGPVAMITMPDIDTQTQATGIVQVVSLAMDANHDGTINTMFNGPDVVSANHPYRFWANNNYDRYVLDADDNEFYDDDVASTDSAANSPYTGVSTPDYDYRNASGQRIIPCARDLEDFTRLWICGIPTNVIAALPHDASITLSWGDVGNPNPNNPTIDVFQATDSDGGIGYLTNGVAAGQQIQSAASYVGRLGPGNSLPLYSYLAQYPWLGNHFIWCGVSNGTGALTLTIKSGTNVLAQTKTYIQIVDIKQMYERWTVGENPNTPPVSMAQPATNDLPAGVSRPFSYANPGSANTPYILYVHGWNMNSYDKDRFAESAFKRLYWQGYKGRFGVFHWPTTYGFTGSFWQALTDTENFDNGEFQAWQSAQGLLSKLNDLNSQYPGHVYVLAHSMGNIVTGEALRLAGNNQVVNTYIASQAAISAHNYDATVTTPYLLPFTYKYPSGALSLLGTNNYGPFTPDIYVNRLTNNIAAVGKRINFYNQNDFALAMPRWGFDQITRPDHPLGGYYHYSGNISDPAPWNHFEFVFTAGSRRHRRPTSTL